MDSCTAWVPRSVVEIELLREVRRLRRGLRHLGDRAGHLLDRAVGFTDVLGLALRGRQQPGRDLLRLVGRAGDLLGGLVDVPYDLAQLAHGDVHAVGDRPGDVLRHTGLGGQIAIGDQRHLVHQTQDRVLVAPVVLGQQLGFVLGAP